MNLFVSLSQAITSLVVVYLLALYLRHRGILEEAHSLTLARIVTELCLPAVVFVNLATSTISLKSLQPALVMLGAELSCIALAWGVGTMFRLSRLEKGAVIFCAAFGSSTFLGYAIIMQLYPQSPQAMTEAVLISEVGVGYPIFILGPMLAAYFGSSGVSFRENISASLGFFKSPVFFALLLGLAWQPLGLPGGENAFVKPLLDVCHVLSQALTPLALIAVGLMFKVPNLRQCLGMLVIVVAIKLLLKPLMLSMVADCMGFERLWKDVLVLLGAMPPAVLGVVFLRRYGGDASLASALLLATTVLSCVTILGVFWIAG
ncbi:AEC family transporter [Desulfogranum mediterraneum]|uniref:AEC family transporter n=1 Tax=Desulfogranum mediterraneum TaxID=160661 RepID=UPI0004198CE3|nr:AEC family transporter [Desulfogranum mediterraneum]